MRITAGVSTGFTIHYRFYGKLAINHRSNVVQPDLQQTVCSAVNHEASWQLSVWASDTI